MSEVNIREVRFEDAPRLIEIYSYYVLNTVITFEYEVPSLEEFENRIRNITRVYPYTVLEVDGKIVGYAYAGVFKGRAAYDWACEMTIYLENGIQKKGYGKLLYQDLEERLKKMGMKNLYACIGYPEVEDEYLTRNSAQFHEHLGFEFCGRFHKCGYKFNRWYDMVWMEKNVGEHLADTEPIRKYKEVR